MKILMTTMSMDIGGAETHILELSRELASRGHEIVVASNGGAYVPMLEEAGVRHVCFPLHSKTPVNLIRSYFGLKQLIRKEKFDLIHSHARIPAMLCGLLSRHCKVRFVTTAHGTFAVNPILRRLTAWGSQTLAVSKDIKEYLIDNYGCCADNIITTINGINTTVFSPDTDPSGVMEELGLAESKKRIVRVGRLDEGCDAASALVRLAPRLYAHDPSVEILLVGAGSDEERLRREADEINRTAGERIVILTGARTDVSSLVALSDIFVGDSRSALEAMAMEKPVILAGTKKYHQGYFGIYTDEKFEDAYNSNFTCRDCPDIEDEQMLRDLCKLLDAEPSARRALGKSGRKVVVERYSVKIMADDCEKIYQRMRPFEPYRHGDVILCGYYGFHNMGDDSLLRQIIENLRAIQPDVRITVLCKSTGEIRKLYGVRTVSRYFLPKILHEMRHAKLFIAGGGNLLQDVTSSRSIIYYTEMIRMAQKQGLKTMVYANGLGPIARASSRQRTVECLKNVDLITLREPESRRFAERIGLDVSEVRLTADPAFLMELPDDAWIAHLRERFGFERGKRYFGIALRNWRQDYMENTEAMARVCDRIAREHDVIPVLLPMQRPQDLAISRQLAEKMETPSLMVTDVTGSEMVGLIRDMEFVVSMRLHALIYAASQNVPVIGISYDKKLDAFLSYVGMPLALPENPSGGEEIYFSAATKALARNTEMRALMAQSCTMMRRLAKEDAGAAIELLENAKRKKP